MGLTVQVHAYKNERSIGNEQAPMMADRPIHKQLYYSREWELVTTTTDLCNPYYTRGKKPVYADVYADYARRPQNP